VLPERLLQAATAATVRLHPFLAHLQPTQAVVVAAQHSVAQQALAALAVEQMAQPATQLHLLLRLILVVAVVVVLTHLPPVVLVPQAAPASSS
jgi:hypothetical protein